MVVNHRQEDCLEFKACWLEVMTRPAMVMWKDLVSEEAKENRSKPQRRPGRKARAGGEG